MIQVRMTMSGLGRTRFAHSPLVEIAESLHLLVSGRPSLPHEAWLAGMRARLDRVDMPLLAAFVPPRAFIARFFIVGPVDAPASVEKQLERLAATPVDVLRQDLEAVWRDDPLPPAAREVLCDPAGGPRRLVDALWRYWKVAIEPDWPAMQAVLDEDVAFRAGELTRHGVQGLLAEMHPDLTVDDDLLRIQKRRHPNLHEMHDLTGTGMLLVPSIFVWPNLLFVAGAGGPPSLTYPARGVGNLWRGARTPARDADALGALLGRSRAAILTSLAIPQTTTELALRFGQSPPSVSQHLAVLSRSGLVVSWRSGRRVLYRRTDLATSVVEASTGAAEGRPRRMS